MKIYHDGNNYHYLLLLLLLLFITIRHRFSSYGTCDNRKGKSAAIILYLQVYCS